MRPASRLWGLLDVGVHPHGASEPHACDRCPSSRCLARLVSEAHGSEPRAVAAVEVHPVLAVVVPTHQWWCVRGQRTAGRGPDPEACDCGAREVIVYVEALRARVAELEAAS